MTLEQIRAQVISTVWQAIIQSKVDLTVTIRNSGDAEAPSVAIAAKKDATVDGKATNEHPPIVIGTLAPGAEASSVLTFSGLKTGLRTLQLTLTYGAGAVMRTVEVSVP